MKRGRNDPVVQRWIRNGKARRNKTETDHCMEFSLGAFTPGAGRLRIGKGGLCLVVRIIELHGTRSTHCSRRQHGPDHDDRMHGDDAASLSQRNAYSR